MIAHLQSMFWSSSNADSCLSSPDSSTSSMLNLAHCLLPCSFHLMKMTIAIKSKCNVRTLVLFGALITRVRSLLQFLVELQVTRGHVLWMRIRRVRILRNPEPLPW